MTTDMPGEAARGALSILIVTDDPAGGEALTNRVAGFDELRLAGVTADEGTALTLLEDRAPDVLLLDMALRLDGGGVSLLRRLRRQLPDADPYILVTTDTADWLLRDIASDYGADMVICKRDKGYSVPFVTDLLLVMRETIRRRAAAPPAEGPEERTRRLTTRIHAELDRLGVSSKLLGYGYLAAGIRITVRDPSVRLGEAVAAEVGKTSNSVERAMKNAIDHTWRHGDENALRGYAARIDPDKGVPTINEFVRYYANKLRLEYS